MRFRARRAPSRYEAVAELPGRLRRVRILDVSDGGARITGAGDLPEGTPCALRILGDTVTAKVRWCDGERAGIAFDHPLSPRQFDTLRQARTARRTSRAPRRQFSFAEMR